MHKVRELRKTCGYDFYYSIDMGPPLVSLTLKNQKDKIVKELKLIVQEYDIIENNIGGSPKLLNHKFSEAKELIEDRNEFGKVEIKKLNSDISRFYKLFTE